MGSRMEFWTADFSPPNPVLTDELVQLAESELGVSLPVAYTDLLRSRNGGYIGSRLVPVSRKAISGVISEYVSDGFVSVGSIFGIGDGTGGSGDIRHTPYLINEWDLPEDLILIDGDGHTWIALDYRDHKGSNPPVIFIESDTSSSITIADSFADLIASLIGHDEIYDHDGNLKKLSP